MIPKQIFLYWRGQKPAYIEYCIETIVKRAGVPVKLLTPDNVNQYVEDVLHPQYKQFTDAAQQADVIRIALLYKYGGMWMDADTLFLKDCAHVFNLDCDVALSKWTSTGAYLNGYILAKPGCDFLKACLDDINLTMKIDPKGAYSQQFGVYFGEALFRRVLEKKTYAIKELPLSIFVPVEFPFHASGNPWITNTSIMSYLKPDTVAITLNHSHFADDVRNASLSHLCGRKDLLGDIFRYSKRFGWVSKYVLEYDYDKSDPFAPVCVSYIKDLFDNVRQKGEGKYETGYSYFDVHAGDLWDRQELFSILDYAENNPSVSVINARRYDCVKNPFFKSNAGVPAPVLIRDVCAGGKQATLGSYFNFSHVGKSLTEVLARNSHDADWVRNVWNKVPSCGGFERVPYAALPPCIGEIPLVRSFIGRAIGKKKTGFAVTNEMMQLVPWPKGLPEGFDERHPLFSQPSFRNRYKIWVERVKEVMGASDDD